MFDMLDAHATSFPTPTTGAAGRSPLPGTVSLPVDIDSWPTDSRLARILDTVDPTHLSDIDRVRYVRAAERMTAHHQAQTLAGIDAVHDSYRGLELDDVEHAYGGTVFELRSALSWTRRYAESEVDLAGDLRSRLPQVLGALSSGRLDKRKAKIIVSDTSHLSVAHARQVADRILEEAERLTTGQVRARIRRAVIDTGPDLLRDQHEKAVADRRLVSWTEPDGTLSLLLTGIDPLRGQELLDRINRIARRHRGDGETRIMDQLRADVAVDLLTGTEYPTVGSIHFTVHPDRLADPDNHSAVSLAGYGPILPDLLRNLDIPHLSDGEHPPADGHGRRRPTAAQIRQVRANHPTCIAPGCRMPSIDCDLDHTIPYAESRWTDSARLAPLCRNDHRIRHTTGWRYTVEKDGAVTWHSPIGTSYRVNNRDP